MDEKSLAGATIWLLLERDFSVVGPKRAGNKEKI